MKSVGGELFRVYLLLPVLLFLLLSGCVEEKDANVTTTPDNSSFGIDVLDVDTIFVASLQSSTILRVAVGTGIVADSVWIEIAADSTIRIPLADDGSARYLATIASPLTTTTSHDLIPNDGVWSRQIYCGALGVASSPLRFFAYRNTELKQVSANWRVVANQPPYIANVTAPDSVYSGVDTSLIVSVFDPDTAFVSGVSTVTAEIYDAADNWKRTAPLTANAGNQSWRLEMPYSFPARLATGNYRFQLIAEDVLHDTVSTSRVVWLENLPPVVDSIQLIGSTVIGNIVYFDSVSHDTVQFTFDVTSDDPQSPFDVTSMRVRLARDMIPGSTIYDSTYREGFGNDITAGDGKIAVTFQLDDRNRPRNPNLVRLPYDHYQITFTANDGGGNRSIDTTFNFQIRVPESARKNGQVQPMRSTRFVKVPNPF
ncbi:MAG: hypothetical protein OEM52_06555 [bacterium]|nr:hypothetical protein [bacterium]